MPTIHANRVYKARKACAFLALKQGPRPPDLPTSMSVHGPTGSSGTSCPDRSKWVKATRVTASSGCAYQLILGRLTVVMLASS
jgi:hypothetical protein